MAELRRQRRQFLTMSQQSPPSLETIADAFVIYLSAALDR